MHTTASHFNSESHSFFNSFFSSGSVAQEDRASPFISERPATSVSRASKHGNGTDKEQRLSAAFENEHRHGCSSTDFDSAESQNTLSPLPMTNEVSASPAASFLSAFSSPSIAPKQPDAPGEVISGYTLGEIVGYGGFSTIRKAYSTSGGIAAVKIVRRSDLFKQGNASAAHKKLKQEAAVWGTLSHEHILPLFSAIHTSYADFFFTLLCPAGSLYDILKRDGRPALPQDDAGMMFRQVVRGLRYLHEVALYVHRDIKLENVLVDEMGVCRIGDFGMTKTIGEIDEEEDEWNQDEKEHHLQDTHLHRAATLANPSSKRQGRTSLPQHLVARHGSARHRNSTSSAQPAAHPAHVFQPGSLPYAAPELILPQTSGPLQPHPAQDIWALGVMLYALLTGRLPFNDSFEPRLQMKILSGTYEVPTDIGRGAERVLKGCLEQSVALRWNIAKVDEVAWGIGWGSEGDDVTPAESDDEDYELQSCRRSSTSASRSSSRPPEMLADPDWQHDDARSRPSMEAASRRSSSRVQRSQSRAPVFTDRSSSNMSTGRSKSRHSRASRPPSPSSFSASHGFVPSSGALSITTSYSSSCDDSALLTSPTSSIDRGRRLQKPHFPSRSRSPSPSVVPATPVDLSVRFSAPLEISEDNQRETSRGRKKYVRTGPALRPEHMYAAGADGVPELDVLDETVGWAAPEANHAKRRESSAARFMNFFNDTQSHDRHDAPEEASQKSQTPPPMMRRQQRPGSTPPARGALWSMDTKSPGYISSASGVFASSHTPRPRMMREDREDHFLTATNPAPSPIKGKHVTRSRSMGFERRAEEAYALRCV